MYVKTGRISQLTKFMDATTNLDYPSWSFDGNKIYFSLSTRVGDIFVLERK